MADDVTEAIERVKAALLVSGDGPTMIAKGSLIRKTDLRTIIAALEPRGAMSQASPLSDEVAAHGPHCSDYLRACRECLDRFDAWKRDQASPLSDEVVERIARLRHFIADRKWPYHGHPSTPEKDLDALEAAFTAMGGDN